MSSIEITQNMDSRWYKVFEIIAFFIFFHLTANLTAYNSRPISNKKFSTLALIVLLSHICLQNFGANRLSTCWYREIQLKIFFAIK